MKICLFAWQIIACGPAYLFDPMRPNGWNSWVDGGIEVIEVPGRHGTYHNEPHVRVLAEKLNACLEQVDCEEKSKCYQTYLNIKELDKI